MRPISEDTSGAVVGEEPAATHAAHVAVGHAYRPEVDGLRALAVIPVILFHAGFELFGGGYVGVDVFFVISGYLITSIILRERLSGRFSLASFYERRARRILPALALVMAACIPFSWFWMQPNELASFGQSLVAVSTFVSNILFWRTSGYFDGAAELKPLLHTWSLGIEEQYYVIFPLVVAVLIRFGMRSMTWAIAAGAVASFAVSLVLTPNQTANFFLLPSRAWELLAGSLLAATATMGVAPRWSRTVRDLIAALGVVLIVAPIFLYDDTTPFPGATALPPVLGTVLVLAFADEKSLVGRLLTLRPILWVGAISYSAYLWHQPLFAFARLMSKQHPSALVYLALTALTLLLAHLSWKYVEAPFRDRGRFTRTQIFGGSALVFGLLIAVGAALALAKGVPQRFSPAELALLTPPKTAIESCPAVGGGVHLCKLGAPDKTPTVALLGDSHAYAIASELDASLARSNRAGILIYTDCHPIPGLYDSREPPTAARVARCDEANKRLLALATAPEIRDVVVAVRWTLRLYPMGDAIDAPAFDNGEGGIEDDTPYRRNLTLGPDGRPSDGPAAKERAVRDFIGGLAETKRTVVLYPVPEVAWSPTRLNLLAAMGSAGPPPSITTSARRFHERNASAEHLLDSIQSPNLRRSRPAALFCDSWVAGRCVVQHGGVLYYSDDDHVSSVGARLIVDDIRKQFTD